MQRLAPPARFKHIFRRMASTAGTGGPGEPMDVKRMVQDVVDKHPVVVFSKSYCPYSRRAKEVLAKEGAHAEIIELDQRTDGDAVQQALGDITGAATVPRVFIGGHFAGGAKEIVEASTHGKLKEWLSAAQA